MGEQFLLVTTILGELIWEAVSRGVTGVGVVTVIPERGNVLKYYLSIACFVLILITSMGIYGFLSAAYQETAAKSGNIDAQITLIEVKRDNIREQLVVYNEGYYTLENYLC